MNNKKSYVEIMKELEIVLPSPKDFDYSKANKEEITNRIMSLLKSITPPDLIEMIIILLVGIVKHLME